jgi:hypothetical protein
MLLLGKEEKKTNISLDELFCRTSTTTTYKKPNKVYAYHYPYTDIEDQTMVTHGPKRRLITATELAELPEPPLSEQEKIIQHREQQWQRQQEQEQQSQISSSNFFNIKKEWEWHRKDYYPDMKKVALSEETGWSQEELSSRADTFLHCFEELAYDGAGNGTVDHNRLQKALSTNKSTLLQQEMSCL